MRSRSQAWYLNNNGNFNGNNNMNNNYRSLSVANLENCSPFVDDYMVTLEYLTDVYHKARANKRRSRDTVIFETNLEANLVRLCDAINGRRLNTSTNYAFVVFSPKPREIFATEMSVRIVHHYIDGRLRPIYERVISGRSFNNRIGRGLHKAVETFRNDVAEMTDNFTREAWLAHLDMKGFFPNANVEIALKQQLDIVENFYEGEDKEDLKYMLTACMRSDPARNCKVYVNPSNWNAIPKEKSLFSKPVGVGGAIGFLCWQNAMGMYINDIIKWLESFDFLRVVVFVDDIYFAVKDKEKFLDLMPEIRSRLAALDVKLNEKKFYIQHYSKGIHFLGHRLKFGRVYADNGTVRMAFRKIEEWKNVRGLQWKCQRLLSSMNTYLSIFKKCNMVKITNDFINNVKDSFGKYIVWNEAKGCFMLKEKFGFKNTLSRKYGVRL